MRLFQFFSAALLVGLMALSACSSPVEKKCDQTAFNDIYHSNRNTFAFSNEPVCTQSGEVAPVHPARN